MGAITLAQAAAWCGGQVAEKFAQVTFNGASNDTRTLLPGQLFVVLKAQRDGHAYIPNAMEKGAAAVLCNHAPEDVPAIVVEDTRIALGKIANAYRKHLGFQAVGVTGSVGKSTTKEMICAVLTAGYRTAKTPANFNNDIGMPMAVLAMPEDTQAAVLEMGMSHFGEIAYLSQVGQPDQAVIINIGTMHMENLGSQEGILQAKMEILEGLHPQGKLFLNGDDSLLYGQKEALGDRAVYFGTDPELCTVWADEIRQAEGSVSYVAHTKELSFPITLPVEGLHHVIDSLAAVAVGLHMAIPPADIADRLSAFRNMEGRQEIFQAKGCTIIKDCYNAGPESMAAALAVLGNRTGRKIAVLGDMLELGVTTKAEHYKVGRIAAEQADILLCYGPNSHKMRSGAVTGGMHGNRAKAFTEQEKLANILCQMAKPGDTILFKGSRGMHMETVLELFLNAEE